MKPLDAIIVGGGIQGVSMALAAARRGLRTALVEKSGLAAGASGGSYGIVHGGLRYLQTLDIARWRRSRRAQAWYLDEFPAYVRPLRCVMPLYRGRLRSPLSFRAAIAMEKTLASAFDAHLPLPPTHLLSAEQVMAEFNIPAQGLTGAACWYDAEVIDMPGLLSAMLGQAKLDEELILIPYEARQLLTSHDKVQGLRINHTRSENTQELKSPVVINCAGSWSNGWQASATCPPACTLAFNLILEGKLESSSALAVSAVPGKGRSYFLRGHPQGLFAGTYYRPAPDSTEPVVTAADIQEFLNALDIALPGLNLKQANVKAVLAGLLPDKDGSGRQLSSRDHILAHGPSGFYSVIGGKFTTAPLLSEEAANLIWPDRPPISLFDLEPHDG